MPIIKSEDVLKLNALLVDDAAMKEGLEMVVTPMIDLLLQTANRVVDCFQVRRQ